MPNNKRLQTYIYKAHHILLPAKHRGQHKTLDLIRKSYYWPSIRNFINRYIHNYNIYRRAKSRKQLK